jgi:hypothetical protein
MGGNDPAVLGHLRRLAGREPQHAGDARPQHVRVDEPDRAASLVERDRQMDGNGRLTHAALAATHRDDVPDPRKPVLIRGRLGQRARRLVVAVMRGGDAHARVPLGRRAAGHGCV